MSIQNTSNSSKWAALAFASGVFLHLSLYRRGEWDLAIPKVVGVYVAISVCTVVWNVFENTDSLAVATRGVLWLDVLHFMGIAGSMSIYRLYFHRLKAFPGPFWARLSNGYHTLLSAKNLSVYEEVQKLHRHYGDFVRIGPSELSITHPGALDAFYSSKSTCTKGPWYNVLEPRRSLHTTRDKEDHTRRRKAWDHGFSTKALRDYEPRVAKYTNQLIAQIEATSGSPINMTTWFNFYSFDVMGDLSFGKSFNMLLDGVKHYFMISLHADMTVIGYLSHLPWLFPFFKITPIVNAEHLKFWKWLGIQVQERRATNPETPDVFSWILEDYESFTETKERQNNLEGDSHLIVVAGSDTTAALLTTLFFELARNRSHIDNLRIELDEYFNTYKTVDHVTLSKLQHLDAVINETMRLHPPVPSGVQRQTPGEGLRVGNVFIPGNTIVQVPYHTLFRDARFFEEPNEFIPERWTSKRELLKNEAVFIPFSTGPYSCVGKQLALMEVRYVVAQIIHRFDVTLALGQSEKSFINGKRDTFTLVLGPLNLVFINRK